MSYFLSLFSFSQLMAGKWDWVETVSGTIIDFVTPALIIACSAGSIYAIVLGVQMAQAENAEKRKEFKQKLLNILISLVCVILLIFLFNYVAENIKNWLPEDYYNDEAGLTDTTTTSIEVNSAELTGVDYIQWN